MPYLEENSEFAECVAPEIILIGKRTENFIPCQMCCCLEEAIGTTQNLFAKAGISKIPKTWDEFLEVCEKIQTWTQAEGKQVIPVQITKENSAYLADALFLDTSQDAKNAVKNHAMLLKKEDVFSVLETMKRILQYGDSTGRNYGYRDEGSMFNSGNAAMYINGVWAGKLIDEKINACYAPFPGKDGSTIASSSVCLGYIVGNTENQKTMDASVES